VKKRDDGLLEMVCWRWSAGDGLLEMVFWRWSDEHVMWVEG
jgi:hypothetical protein